MCIIQEFKGIIDYEVIIMTKQTKKSSNQKVWNNKNYSEEKPISSAYKIIDNDLARDNIENDIPEADLQDI